MTPADHLRSELSKVDWNSNVASFLASPAAATSIADANFRISLWANSLSATNPGNPANGFLYGMQAEGHYVAALIPLSLYKPAASSMRASVEAALYYSYFRHHPMELGTLTRTPSFFMEKSSIIEFHKAHTPGFTEKQQALGLTTGLNAWYSTVSAIIHGQIPGAWTTQTSLSGVGPVATIQTQALSMLDTAVSIINALFLASISRDDWAGFTKASRQEFLKGIAGATKKILDFSVG